MNNLEIIQQLYQVFSEGDTETILKLFDPQIEWIQNEGFPGGGRYLGSHAVVNNVFAKFRLEWETWQAVVNEWLDAGDTIIALGEYRGVYRSTGKSTTAAFAHVYKLRDGRVVRYHQYTDTLKVAEAMDPIEEAA
ncbi:nuclear transport factor 2 family protein [Scytonema tolypothrichoides VB-61278]|nr:nuclear transport factor 2 family protein [Scytonema tolypothrichoides VB-61278]